MQRPIGSARTTSIHTVIIGYHNKARTDHLPARAVTTAAQPSLALESRLPRFRMGYARLQGHRRTIVSEQYDFFMKRSTQLMCGRGKLRKNTENDIRANRNVGNVPYLVRLHTLHNSYTTSLCIV